MPKKKDSMALFEVIAKSRNKDHTPGTEVPAWMGDKAIADEVAQPQVETTAETQAGPKLSAGGGRIDISLDYVSCVVVAMAAMLALVCSFWLGRVSVPPAAQIDLTDRVPMNPGVLGDKPIASKARPAAQARQSDKWYIFIETLKGLTDDDRQEAERIVDYLAAVGEPAEVVKVELSNGKYVYAVWSLVGFDDPSSQAVKDYASRIEELGKKYFEEYKTYRFQQRQTPTSPLTPAVRKW